MRQWVDGLDLEHSKLFARKYEKKDSIWNIRHLVDETINPATQRIILKIVGFLEEDLGMGQRMG